MADHITNVLKSAGDFSLVEVLQPFITDGDLDFEKVIASPTGLPAEQLMEWRKENWGVKTNSFNCFDFDDDGIVFYTDWEPCIPLVEKLSQITGKDFEYFYAHEGKCFFGSVDVTPEKSEVRCYDYYNVPKDLKDMFFEEEEEEFLEEEEE